jgi:hypothetical protein
VLLAVFLLLFGATRAWAVASWLSPVNLSTAGRDAQLPEVAMDDAGDAVVVWQRPDGTNLRVQAVTRSAGSGFSAPVNLSTAGRDAEDPEVAMDEDGDAVAVWSRFDGSDFRVQAVTRSAGGGFSVPVNLSAAGEDGILPQVAMDKVGNAVVVWRRFDGANIRVQAATRPAGGAFSGPVNLSPAGEDGFTPAVAMGETGDAVAAWGHFDGPDSRVQVATRPAGGAFSGPVDISAAGVDAFTPAVAMDQDGDAVAVWTRDNGANRRVQTANRPAGGAFSAPVNLSSAAEDATGPGVAVGDAGDAVAIWRRFDGLHNIVQTATRPAGGDSSAPSNRSASGGEAGDAGVAMNGPGDALAAWHRFNGANHIVQAASRPAGGAFGGSVNLTAAGRDAFNPQTAMDNGGDGIAVWQRFNGANFIVQAAGYDADNPQLLDISTPRSASVGVPVDFSATFFDVWGPVTTSWSFGDGASPSRRGAVGDRPSVSDSSVSHTYCSPGNYQVKVTGTDAAGNATSAARSISIAGSSEFGFGEVDKNRKKGTAKLAVEVPQAGALELDQTKKVKGATADAACNGEVSLPVKARGKTKRKLKRKGKAKVKAKVTFEPTGGDPTTHAEKVKLKKKR